VAVAAARQLQAVRWERGGGGSWQCNGGIGSALAAGAAWPAVRQQRGGEGGGSAAAAWRWWRRRQCSSCAAVVAGRM
jgi:hypothetical protein